MGTPTWLYYLFAVLMLAVAAYAWSSCRSSSADGRLGTGRRYRPHRHGRGHGRHVRPRMGLRTERRLGAGLRALLVWFIVRSIQSIQQLLDSTYLTRASTP